MEPYIILELWNDFNEAILDPDISNKEEIQVRMITCRSRGNDSIMIAAKFIEMNEGDIINNRIKQNSLFLMERNQENGDMKVSPYCILAYTNVVKKDSLLCFIV